VQLELHDRLGQPIRLDCTRVVLRDDLGNPVMVALKVAQGVIYCSKAGDKDFLSILKEFGISDTLIVTDAQLVKPPEIMI
jgi:hypothetical protein